MKVSSWPHTVKSGSVSITVYRSTHPKTKSGWIYQFAFVGLDGKRKVVQRTTPDAAVDEAKDRAEAIALGRPEMADFSRSDRDELLALRKLSGAVKPVIALQEWARAKELAGEHLIEAAKAWADNHHAKSKGYTAKQLVNDFIAAKESLGFQGENTYRRKLNPFVDRFGEREAVSISESEFTDFLNEYEDEGTRNDRRARLLTMYKWGRLKKKLPNKPLEIQITDRAKETLKPIGIITPATLKDLLTVVHRETPNDLAAAVLANLCGIRSDEIHGKREDRDNRQVWEDIFPDRGFVRVTNAKENTPDHRLVPLCPAAVAWLKLIPADKRKGHVCEALAVERVRRTGKNAKLKLPKNCFRHSFISHRVAALDGNKPQVATEAGTSVSKIDQRYRVPLTKAEGVAWFEVWPEKKSPEPIQ